MENPDFIIRVSHERYEDALAELVYNHESIVPVREGVYTADDGLGHVKDLFVFDFNNNTITIKTIDFQKTDLFEMHPKFSTFLIRLRYNLSPLRNGYQEAPKGEYKAEEIYRNPKYLDKTKWYHAINQTQQAKELLEVAYLYNNAVLLDILSKKLCRVDGDNVPSLWRIGKAYKWFCKKNGSEENYLNYLLELLSIGVDYPDYERLVKWVFKSRENKDVEALTRTIPEGMMLFKKIYKTTPKKALKRILKIASGNTRGVKYYPTWWYGYLRD